MVRKVRVVLEYELGSFSAHQFLPSHGQAPHLITTFDMTENLCVVWLCQILGTREV